MTTNKVSDIVNSNTSLPVHIYEKDLIMDVKIRGRKKKHNIIHNISGQR